jgi:hypothetical protein
MALKHLTLSLLLATLAFASCKKDEVEPTPDPGPSTKVIIPGVGTTELKIGDEAQKAIDLYGPPFPLNSSAGGIYYHYLTYTSKGVIIYIEPTSQATFNAQMKIKSLKLSGVFALKTEKGIGIGSTKAEVIAAYGNPASSSPGTGDKYAIGLVFFYDVNSKVTSISVEKP